MLEQNTSKIRSLQQLEEEYNEDFLQLDSSPEDTDQYSKILQLDLSLGIGLKFSMNSICNKSKLYGYNVVIPIQKKIMLRWILGSIKVTFMC